MRRTMLVTALVAAMALTVTAPAQAIIHEIVASHCAGHQGSHGNVDPPGQLNQRGRSFAAALQATGVFELRPGVDQGGVVGLNLMTRTFGPLPAPGIGEASLTVLVDNEHPSAKLGDEFVWGYFAETTPDGVLHVYIQLYELDHPAFEHCPNFVGH